MNPRDLVPASHMPGYPWMASRPADDGTIQARMRALAKLGHPNTPEEIENAPAELKDHSEMDAVIAYLQVLGTALNQPR
jgi:cytochrome c oxidase cbb3-type subunit 2